MKKMLFSIVIGSSAFLLSCNKDQSLVGGSTNNNFAPGSGSVESARGGGGSNNGALTPFGLLGLDGGTFTINSGTTLIADVGYSAGVTSNINQKITTFTGTAYVHSQVASFIYTAATYQPTGGIIQNNNRADSILDDANANALAASTQYAAMTPDVVLGNVITNQTITHAALNTVVQMTSMNYNSNILNLVGTPGGDDGFIINVTGSFDFSQSEIRLTNVRPERVIFNFPNASAITVNKSANIFNGTILAPTGSVIYHNPAVFNGAIIAKNIAVHSSFNLTQKAFIFNPGM
jgi:hypothetical protein